jgi:hypothetical protein
MYVLLAVTFTILRSEILTEALLPVLPLKIFRMIGSALFAEWERICLKRKNKGEKTESAVKSDILQALFLKIDILVL